MDNLWLPRGNHWGLNISHNREEDAGPFTGGGHKLVWHTTEGSGIDNMYKVLVNKRACPHFLIDPSAGPSRVIQMIPLNRAGRALQHSSGPETNRANCIQVEIVDFAKNAPGWNDTFYRDLGALAALIDHRFDIPRVAPLSFTPPARRMGGLEFVNARGHFGHCHVPGNIHWDPGHMNRTKLITAINDVEKHYN